MTYVNVFDRQRMIRATRPANQEDYGFMDALGASAEEALRTMPTMSLARGYANLKDKSESIDPLEANEKFNLLGKAAFKEGEKVTVDMAAARAEDQADLATRNHIQGMYAQNNPVKSVLANLAGGLAMGFVDPALMAINIAAGAGLAATLGRVATSTKIGRATITSLNRVSPNAGTAILKAYDHRVAKNLTTVMAREGAENFVASTLEETINFAGVGEGRLARKVTAEESLRNIIIGTTLGTGFGTILDKNGRAGISRAYHRMFGDNAADVVGTQNKVLASETKMGVPDGKKVNEKLNKEVFEPKPEHIKKDTGTGDYTENPYEQSYFIPVKSDEITGSEIIHNISGRGKFVTMTTNITQAQNLGQKVKQLDINEANILKPSQFEGDVKTDAIRGILDHVDFLDDGQLNGVYSKILEDPTFKGKVPVSEVKAELEAMLLETNSIDEFLEAMDGIFVSGRIDLDPHQQLGRILDKYGYDGYSYVGKDYNFNPAYTGVALTPNGVKKAKVADTFDVPQPSTKQSQERIKTQVREAEEYVKDVKTRQEEYVNKTDTEMLPEDLEVSQTMPAEELNKANTASLEYKDSPVVKESVDAELNKYAEIEKQRDLTVEESKERRRLERIADDKKFVEELDATVKNLQDYFDCMD